VHKEQALFWEKIDNVAYNHVAKLRSDNKAFSSLSRQLVIIFSASELAILSTIFT